MQIDSPQISSKNKNLYLLQCNDILLRSSRFLDLYTHLMNALFLLQARTRPLMTLAHVNKEGYKITHWSISFKCPKTVKMPINRRMSKLTVAYSFNKITKCKLFVVC